MDGEYVANGKKVVLAADPSLIAIRFIERAPHATRAALVEGLGLGSFERRLEIPDEKYTIVSVPVSPLADVDHLATAAAALQDSPDVARFTPVYRVGRNYVVATDRVLMGFDASETPNERVLARRGLRVLESHGRYRVLELRKGESPFTVSSKLRELAGVAFAEPDFVTLFNPLPPPVPALVLPKEGTDDPYRFRQDYLDKIHATEVRGDPAVAIAVLDVTIDTRHEDLVNISRPGFDAVRNCVLGGLEKSEVHGTVCAGLAVAEVNTVGIRGAGTGCSLLPVRIAKVDPGTPWVMCHRKIARGIDWAWRNGAAVLSMSWYTVAESTWIAEAIRRARKRGRGRKGCVVVVAAGNIDGLDECPYLGFPANQPGVLTVAASTIDDRPKMLGDGAEYSDRDWGSAVGREVSIAAPGVQNYTTDNTGESGFNANAEPAGNYTQFSGTSAAAPLVAGAAGLLLSVNPHLTEREVRMLLCDNADKVPCLDEYDAFGHSLRMGFGRLNVLRAVTAAAAAGACPDARAASLRQQRVGSSSSPVS